MAKQILTDPLRFLVALHAGAYMRWHEVRKGKSPAAENTQLFIKGLLDADGCAYEDDEPRMIEILALTLNIDMVHQFIKDTGAFEKFDKGTTRSSLGQ